MKIKAKKIKWVVALALLPLLGLVASATLLRTPAINFSTDAGQKTQASQELTEKSSPEPATETPVNFASLLLRTVLSLIFVAALIYVCVALLRKYTHLQDKKAGSHLIEVVSSTFLAPKKSIYLVQVLDRLLVLGVTEASISLLSEIPQSEAQELRVALGTKVPRKPTQFGQTLEKFLKKMGQ